MTMELLFVKGDKGLAANHNGKFYFPDRKSSIKTEGLYECNVTIDKDKYAFVDGKPIKTFEPDEATVQNLSKSKVFRNNRNYDIPNITMFRLKKIGESLVMFIAYDNNMKLSYFDENSRRHDFSLYELSSRHYSNARTLYAERKFENAVDYAGITSSAVLESARELLTRDDEMKAAVMVVCDNVVPFVRMDTTGCYEIYDKKIIVADVHDYRGNYRKAYIVKDDGHVTDVSELISDAEMNGKDFLSKKTGTVEMTDLRQWMIENHVGRIYKTSNDNRLLHRTVSVMGYTLTVAFFDGNNIMQLVTETDKKLVNNSFAELEALRKKIGKNISRGMISELKKLSPVDILGLN